MNNSAKYACCIMCLIFIIVIVLILTKDIIMDNNEKNIQENFRGGGGGGFSGNGGGMGGRGFSGNFGANRMGGTPQRAMISQGNMRRGLAGASALGSRHIYNRNHGWRNHSSNYYRPFFYSAPLWYWNNGGYNNDGGSYYDSYPDTVNYNFYDVREGDDNNYDES